MTITKKEQEITKVGKGVEKLKSLRLAGGNVKWHSAVGDRMVVPQEVLFHVIQ